MYSKVVWVLKMGVAKYSSVSRPQQQSCMTLCVRCLMSLGMIVTSDGIITTFLIFFYTCKIFYVCVCVCVCVCMCVCRRCASQ